MRPNSCASCRPPTNSGSRRRKDGKKRNPPKRRRYAQYTRPSGGRPRTRRQYATRTTKISTDEYASETQASPDKHSETTTVDFAQGRYFSGSMKGALKLPLAKLSYSDFSGGSSLSSVTFVTDSGTDAPSSDPSFTTETTAVGFDDATGGAVLIKRYVSDSDPGKNRTTLDICFDAGDTTVYSDGYCHSTLGGYTCRGGDYTSKKSNSTTPNGAAPRVTLGADYKADVVVQDAATQYTAHPSFALTPSPDNGTVSDAPFCTTITPVPRESLGREHR